jgi:hypothetical protein
MELVFLVLSLVSILSLSAGAESISSRYNEPYPVAASKKGLQVELVDDALALGIKHAAQNINLTALFVANPSENDVTFVHEGEAFRFRRGYLESMDRQIKTLSQAGVLVNLIVLSYASGRPEVDRVVLHPKYDPTAPNRLGAFNTVTPEGQKWFSACLSFLAERWSRPDQQFGRVVGYIISNEVNSHWYWSNLGRATMHEFADDHLRTVRLAHRMIRQQSSWARIYLSLDHHWNIRYSAGDRYQTFAGREFLEYFAHRAKAEGDFDWHLAFHPYPENLFKPDFWNDKTATTNATSPRITFKNLEVLAEFMNRPELQYAGKSRRIILSEQGFTRPTASQANSCKPPPTATHIKRSRRWTPLMRLSCIVMWITTGKGDYCSGCVATNQPVARRDPGSASTTVFGWRTRRNGKAPSDSLCPSWD